MKLLKNKRKIIALMCSVIFVFTMFASTGIISSAESTKTMNKFKVSISFIFVVSIGLTGYPPFVSNSY